MKKDKLYNCIGEIDDSLIMETEHVIQKSNRNRIKYKRLASIACALIVIIGIFVFIGKGGQEIKLTRSVGDVKVMYANKNQNSQTMASADLVWYTEKELFTIYDTVIFKGRIEEIENIIIDFNGQKEDRAIAKIQVDHTYRGNLVQGETISVLLPCSINSDSWVEDTGTVSAMRKGMVGIFMPIKYESEDYREQNGCKLYLSEVSEYGFLDGERYAFLETNEGLIFAREAYESIKDATTLSEIETYITTMIQ